MKSILVKLVLATALAGITTIASANSVWDYSGSGFSGTVTLGQNIDGTYFVTDDTLISNTGVYYVDLVDDSVYSTIGSKNLTTAHSKFFAQSDPTASLAYMLSFTIFDGELSFVQLDDLKFGGAASLAFTPQASAVSEPESYAMFLAGLGLVGFTVRRRD